MYKFTSCRNSDFSLKLIYMPKKKSRTPKTIKQRIIQFFSKRPRLSIVIGLSFLALVLVGTAVGMVLVNQSQDNRSMASDGGKGNCCWDSSWPGGPCGKNGDYDWVSGYWACERGECSSCKEGEKQVLPSDNLQVSTTKKLQGEICKTESECLSGQCHRHSSRRYSVCTGNYTPNNCRQKGGTDYCRTFFGNTYCAVENRGGQYSTHCTARRPVRANCSSDANTHGGVIGGDANMACNEGLVCLNGKCVEKDLTGACPGFGPNGCPSGSYCNESRNCRQKKYNSEVCRENFQCQSGRCAGGVCR